MKATHHDHKTLHIDATLSEVAEDLMKDEHTHAVVYRLKQDRPEGFVSRNRRRAAYEAENN